MGERTVEVRRFKTIGKTVLLAVAVGLSSCFLQPGPSTSNTEPCPKGVTGLITPGPTTIGGFTNYLGNTDWRVTQCPPFPSKRIRIESTDPATLKGLIETASQTCQVLAEKRIDETSVDLTTGKENCLLEMPIQ